MGGSGGKYPSFVFEYLQFSVIAGAVSIVIINNVNNVLVVLQPGRIIIITRTTADNIICNVNININKVYTIHGWIMTSGVFHKL